MTIIEKFPKNKNKFIRLTKFLDEIIEILNQIKVKPIIYGSFAVFTYTKNIKMCVNDIDILFPEKGFNKIIPILNLKKIKYNYDTKWHVLQIIKDDLKIELDSIEFWNSNISKKCEKINLNNKEMLIINLQSLKLIYEKAIKENKNNSKKYISKLKELEKTKNDI